MVAENVNRISYRRDAQTQLGSAPTAITVTRRMKPKICLIRNLYTPKSASGYLLLGDSEDRFCYTLEDTPRDVNIKIPGHTGLPAGEYLWKVTPSVKFGRDLIQIYTESDLSIHINGIHFFGVRFHGGNTDEDTEGCPLVAYNRINADRIYGTAEKELTRWAKAVGGGGTLKIINK